MSLDVELLYAEHAPFVARVVQRLLGDGPHVDDLLQETFVVAFQKRHAFAGRSSERTWLYGIASNLSRRHARGTRRFRSFLHRLSTNTSPADTSRDEDRPDRALEQQQEMAIVHRAIQTIPFAQREAFVLYELEGLDGATIADLLGIPINTVWTRLHHGRKRFEMTLRKRISAGRGA